MPKTLVPRPSNWTDFSGERHQCPVEIWSWETHTDQPNQPLVRQFRFHEPLCQPVLVLRSLVASRRRRVTSVYLGGLRLITAGGQMSSIYFVSSKRVSLTTELRSVKLFDDANPVVVVITTGRWWHYNSGPGTLPNLMGLWTVSEQNISAMGRILFQSGD